MPADKQPKEADVSKVLTPKAPVKDEKEAIKEIAQNLKSKAFLEQIMQDVMAMHPSLMQAEVIQAIEDSLANNNETTQIAQDLVDGGIGNTDDIKADTGQDIASHNLENQGMSPQQAQEAVDASETAQPVAPLVTPEAAQEQAQAVESAGAGGEGAELPQPEEVAPGKEGDRARELREQQEQAKKRPEDFNLREAYERAKERSEEANKIRSQDAQKAAQEKVGGKKPEMQAQPEAPTAPEAAEGVQAPAEEEATVPTEEEQAPAEEEAQPAETVEPGAEPEAGAQLGAKKVAAKGVEDVAEKTVVSAGEKAVAGVAEGAAEGVIGVGGWIALAVVIVLMFIPGVMIFVGLAMWAFNDWLSKILTSMIMGALGALDKTPGLGKIANKLGLDKAKKGTKGMIKIVLYALGTILLILGGAYIGIIVHLGNMSVWDWTWAWVQSKVTPAK